MSTAEEKRKKLNRYAKIQNVTGVAKKAKPTGADLQNAITRLSKKLVTFAEDLRMEVNVTKGAKRSTWSINKIQNKIQNKTEVTAAPSANPELTVTVSQEDAWNILSGAVSPAEVFLKGNMIINGKCVTARKVYAKLGGRGETDV
ncbi:MAG: hypothetical protein GY777_28825 [Candidatus Brocadiaceae bacterium]|nr:hypothetical protein [Candidatus Brocadiaceae bacterium]